MFNFVPEDPSAIQIPSKREFSLWTSKGSPSQEWLDDNQIKVGTSIEAIWGESLTGTCTPIRITFPTLPDSPQGS